MHSKSFIQLFQQTHHLIENLQYLQAILNHTNRFKKKKLKEAQELDEF